MKWFSPAFWREFVDMEREFWAVVARGLSPAPRDPWTWLGVLFIIFMFGSGRLLYYGFMLLWQPWYWFPGILFLRWLL